MDSLVHRGFPRETGVRPVATSLKNQISPKASKLLDWESDPMSPGVEQHYAKNKNNFCGSEFPKETLLQSSAASQVSLSEGRYQERLGWIARDIRSGDTAAELDINSGA